MKISRASDEPFSTTVTYGDFPAFERRAHIIERADDSLLTELRSAWTLFREATQTRAMLLDSTSGRLHPDLLASILIGFLPKKHRPVIVFMGAMWQKDPGLQGLVQEAIIRLADRSIMRYALQATDEFPRFSEAWGIPESKLRFAPYFHTFTKEDLEAPAPPPEAIIFSGGNSHRDYRTYLEAIQALPEYNFIVAARPLERQPLPPNVRWGPVRRDEFIRLMRASAAVVVPLRRDLNRAAGQQTYLNAMLLGKPTIITQSLGVIDYVQNNDAAWVVEGSAESYVSAIREIFDPANREKVRQVTGRAQAKVLQQFTFERHAECLVQVLDEAIAEVLY